MTYLWLRLDMNKAGFRNNRFRLLLLGWSRWLRLYLLTSAFVGTWVARWFILLDDTSEYVLSEVTWLHIKNIIKVVVGVFPWRWWSLLFSNILLLLDWWWSILPMLLMSLFAMVRVVPCRVHLLVWLLINCILLLLQLSQECFKFIFIFFFDVELAVFEEVVKVGKLVSTISGACRCWTFTFVVEWWMFFKTTSWGCLSTRFNHRLMISKSHGLLVSWYNFFCFIVFTTCSHHWIMLSSSADWMVFVGLFNWSFKILKNVITKTVKDIHFAPVIVGRLSMTRWRCQILNLLLLLDECKHLGTFLSKLFGLVFFLVVGVLVRLRWFLTNLLLYSSHRHAWLLLLLNWSLAIAVGRLNNSRAHLGLARHTFILNIEVQIWYSILTRSWCILLGLFVSVADSLQV